MQLVTYRAASYLNCSPCGGKVILCVDETLTDSGAPYLEGRISTVQQNPDKSWTYNFSYDPADLAVPTTLLTGCDINGVFCKGCLTDYIEYLFSLVGSPNEVVDTPTINFTASGALNRTISGSVNLSSTAGNQLTADGTGLYINVPAHETANSVTDTSTIDFSASGTLNRAITGSVKISADADNIISAHSDGLFAQAIQTVETSGQCEGVGSDYMVRDAEILSGNALRIVSAPEHKTLSDVFEDSWLSGSTINAPGTINTHTSATQTYINPSECRSMSGVLIPDFSYAYSKPVGDDVEVRGEINIDSGGFTTVRGDRKKALMAWDGDDRAPGNPLEISVAPGGSLTVITKASLIAVAVTVGTGVICCGGIHYALHLNTD